jgi:hypothetical protein
VTSLVWGVAYAVYGVCSVWWVQCGVYAGHHQVHRISWVWRGVGAVYGGCACIVCRVLCILCGGYSACGAWVGMVCWVLCIARLAQRVVCVCARRESGDVHGVLWIACVCGRVAGAVYGVRACIACRVQCMVCVRASCVACCALCGGYSACGAWVGMSCWLGMLWC